MQELGEVQVPAGEAESRSEESSPDFSPGTRGVKKVGIAARESKLASPSISTSKDLLGGGGEFRSSLPRGPGSARDPVGAPELAAESRSGRPGLGAWIAKVSVSSATSSYR